MNVKERLAVCGSGIMEQPSCPVPLEDESSRSNLFSSRPSEREAKCYSNLDPLGSYEMTWEVNGDLLEARLHATHANRPSLEPDHDKNTMKTMDEGKAEFRARDVVGNFR